MSKEQRPWLESYPEGVPDTIDPCPFANLADMFDYACEKYDDRTAFINMFGSMSFKQTAKEAEAFASFLQNEWQLKKGDKLAVMMPNLLQYPVAVFGALKAGLTVVNVNPLYTPRELQLQLQDSGVSAIVVIANFAFNLQKIVASTQIKHIIITNVGDGFGFIRGHLVNFVVRFISKMVPKFLLPGAVSFRYALRKGSQKPFMPVMLKPDDIAYLQYTGGTTGVAKGAMLSHGNILANISQALGMYGQIITRGEEMVLTAIPLYHVFAHTINLMLFFAIGGTNLLITDPRNIKSFIAQLKRHHRELSVMTGVNTLFNALIIREVFKKIKFKRLRLVIGGGAAVQSGVEVRFFKETGIHILEGYGLTECSPLCCVNPPTAKTFNGSIGIPVPSTLARIVDDKGEPIWDLGVPGELEFKGPQVMKGYYHNPEGTANVMHGDYVRTGDIAIWLEHGYIKIIDRLKDMILVSGFNVFPSEIEDVVSRFDRVAECAVVGVPSDKTGEAIKLIAVKRDPTLTAEELRAFCRGYLTPYKVPRYIEFVDVLPKSAIGKVLRRCLKHPGKAHPNQE